MKVLHRYVGLLLCGFVFCISLTGTLLLLKKEYLWISMPEARASIDDSGVANAIKYIERLYKGNVRFVRLNSHDLSIHKVFLPDHNYAFHGQDGLQVRVWQGNEAIEDWLLDLHHRFLLGNAVGLNIAGASGVLLLPLTTVGLMLWWPNRRFWKLRTSFKSTFANARKSHTNFGALLVLPIILVALTGVILVYPSESRWLLLNGFSNKPLVPVLVKKNVINDTWQSQIDFALTEFPGARLRWVQPANEDGGKRVIGISQQGAWDVTGKTTLKFINAQEVLIKDARNQSTMMRTVDLSYALHIGGIAFLYRLLLIAVGVGMCALTFFGFQSYRLRSKR